MRLPNPLGIPSKCLESLYRRVFWAFAPSLKASQICRHTPVFYDRCRIPHEAASRGIVCFLSRNPRIRRYAYSRCRSGRYPRMRPYKCTHRKMRFSGSHTGSDEETAQLGFQILINAFHSPFTAQSAFGFRPLAINVRASSFSGLDSEMKQAERWVLSA